MQDNLPAANCGACGYGACQSYAESVVEDGEVSPTLCTPGGQEVAFTIGELTGKEVGEIKDVVASLTCSGSLSVAKQQAEYVGIHSCSAATISFGGPKNCKYGCIGLGDCVHVCAFDAMEVGESGIVEINRDNCTGCGLCIDACPKLCLDMVSRDHRVLLTCITKEKGVKAVEKTCVVGCIQCKLCIKACPADAISLVDGLVKVEHQTCIDYGPSCDEACIEVCPTEIIHLPARFPITAKEKKAALKEKEKGAGEAA